jgi:hypothetical protein
MGYPCDYTMARSSPTSTRSLREGFSVKELPRRSAADPAATYAYEKESMFRVRQKVGTSLSSFGGGTATRRRLHTSSIGIVNRRMCVTNGRAYRHRFGTEGVEAMNGLLPISNAVGVADPNPTMPTAAERHYTPSDVADLWRLNVETIRRLFQNEPGVMVLQTAVRKGKRPYKTIRIPHSVLERVRACLQR